MKNVHSPLVALRALHWPLHSHVQRGRSIDYFKLIVVFTPCEIVLSSNQRAVTVLVCV